jgi:ABC-type enterochelin transport system permease subunit
MPEFDLERLGAEYEMSEFRMLKIVTCLAAVAIAVVGPTLTASAKKSRQG